MRLEKYRKQARQQAKNALTNSALALMFASFAKVIPDAYGHGFIFGGNIVLATLNIIPTLVEKLNRDQKSKLLIALHYIKKAVAATEGMALGAVCAEQVAEILKEENLVQQILSVLIPAFAVILGANGILNLISKLEQMLNKDSLEDKNSTGLKISISQILDLVIGAGGTIGQSAVIITILKGGVDKENGNKINALIGLGQALTAGALSIWNVRKVMAELPNLDLNRPLISTYEVEPSPDSVSDLGTPRV